MKHAGIFLTITLLLICFTANAQTKDSLYIKMVTSSEKQDTIFLKKIANGKITDTFLITKRVTFDTKDSLFLKDPSGVYIYKYDSMYAFQKKDTLGRHKVFIAYHKDSLQRNFNYQKYNSQNTLYLKTNEGFLRLDSLKRMNMLYAGKNTNYRLYSKYDTLKWIKQDTMRIHGQLNRLKLSLQRIREDSLQRNKKLNKKEISMEVSCGKDGTVTIKNLSRKIIVKTFNEKKVKLVTTVYAETGFESKDIDWDKELNLGIEQNKNDVIIRPSETRTATTSGSGYNSMTLTYTNNNITYAGNVADSRIYNANKKSEVIIYIPAGAKLKMENRYNDISILNNISTLDADLINVNLKMLDAGKAVIKLKYGSVKAGDIKDADVTIVNCKFSSGDIDKLIIDSKYSTVTFRNSRVLDMTSVSDEYTIAQAGTVTVNKNFGKLNIGSLQNSIELTGSSADVNIKAINASVKSIKINNKYADVKLSLQLLNNYTLQFDGNYSRVFTPFETVADASDKNKVNVNFTKTVGNVKKDFTAFDVKCASCSVDFR